MKKSYIILVVLLAVLLLTAYLVMQKQGEQNLSAESAQKFITLDSLSVDKIVIHSPSLSLMLEKQGGNWMIKEPLSFKAGSSTVGDLIHQIKELEVKSIASSNPEKQSLFNVDSAGGVHVAMYENGNMKSSFIVGKAGPSYSDTYVRKTGSNDVVLVNASLTYSFTKPVKEWRDKTIFSASQENIKEVTYQYGDTTFTLKNTNGAWMIGSDSTQMDAVTSLLSSLADVKADDFLDTANAATKKIMAQITYGYGQVHFAYDKNTKKYYAQSSASPQWFVVEEWKANQLLKRKKDLVRK